MKFERWCGGKQWYIGYHYLPEKWFKVFLHLITFRTKFYFVDWRKKSTLPYSDNGFWKLFNYLREQLNKDE